MWLFEKPWSSEVGCPDEAKAPPFNLGHQSLVSSIHRVAFVLLVGWLLFLAVGCGYHVAGKAVAIPQNIDSIAVLIFTNRTPKYRLEQRLTSAVIDEFIA